ncbi:MAG: hypothetical protein ACRDZX_05775 [Acidimicrobiales bacterium]
MSESTTADLDHGGAPASAAPAEEERTHDEEGPGAEQGVASKGELGSHLPLDTTRQLLGFGPDVLRGDLPSRAAPLGPAAVSAAPPAAQCRTPLKMRTVP